MDLASELAQWERWNGVLSMVATVAFSVTGVLAITEKRSTDLLGAIVFGVITAIGGGTVRDVILDVPPFWIRSQAVIGVAAGAAVVAFYGRRAIEGRWVHVTLIYLDGLGAAMFAVQATGVVWFRDFAIPTGPIILGLITAIGGGLLRDVLAGRPTLLVRPQLYATPVLLGSIASTLVLWLAPELWGPGSLLCFLGTFGFRAAAIHWGLEFPGWARHVVEEDGDPP